MKHPTDLRLCEFCELQSVRELFVEHKWVASVHDCKLIPEVLFASFYVSVYM